MKTPYPYQKKYTEYPGLGLSQASEARFAAPPLALEIAWPDNRRCPPCHLCNCAWMTLCRTLTNCGRMRDDTLGMCRARTTLLCAGNRPHISQLCEMGLYGFLLDVIMGVCCIRKVRKIPTTRYVPASGRKAAASRTIAAMVEKEWIPWHVQHPALSTILSPRRLCMDHGVLGNYAPEAQNHVVSA